MVGNHQENSGGLPSARALLRPWLHKSAHSPWCRVLSANAPAVFVNVDFLNWVLLDIDVKWGALTNGCGSKIGTQDGTLVNETKD